MHEIKATTCLAGVIGWPIKHSLSPQMQNAAIARLGLEWAYVAMPVTPEAVREAILGAQALGFVGLNVTIPHKQTVLPLMDELDPLAAAIGAVNTIHFKDGRRVGYNTDAVGFTRTVEEESAFRFDGATMLMLGAGGAGRALAAGAAMRGATRVLIYESFRPEFATELAATMNKHFGKTKFEVIETNGLAAASEAVGAARGLIAQATPLGMKPDDALPLAEALIPADCTVFDAVYVPADTALLKAAGRRGAAIVGGLGMLARQGAQSLRIWSGQEPDEQLMIDILRQALQAKT